MTISINACFASGLAFWCKKKRNQKKKNFIQLTEFPHLFSKLLAPAAEDKRAHGHGEDVVGELSASVTVLHFLIVAKLLKGFVRRHDLVEQTAQGEFLGSLYLFRFVEPVDGGGGDAEPRRVEAWSGGCFFGGGECLRGAVLVEEDVPGSEGRG